MIFCKIDDCNKKHFGKGLCQKHYNRLRRHGDTSITLRKRNPHGLTHHPMFQTYSGMMNRCYNEKHEHYKNYGDRGIEVEEYLQDVKNYCDYIDEFLGPKPSPKHTIDRIENDEGYKRGNLRWASRKEQIKNRREFKRVKKPVGISGERHIYLKRKKWACSIPTDSKPLYLGSYNTIEDAVEARDNALKIRDEIRDEIRKDIKA